MAANEGCRPSERLRINKHHGWRASKPSRMTGRISGRESVRVWKAANRRFCASFRPLTSNHRGGHRSPVSRKEADSRGRPAHRRRIPTDPKTCLPQTGHQTDDVRFRPSGRVAGVESSSPQSWSSMFIVLGATKNRPQPHSSSPRNDEPATQPPPGAGATVTESSMWPCE